jgi:S-adenosylmethionine synthetase
LTLNIIKELNLPNVVYSEFTSFGHFGRSDLNLNWEKTDKVKVLLNNKDSIIKI